MSEQKRQENMKELGNRIKLASIIHWGDDCDFESNWVTFSNHLSEGEIMLALSSYRENEEFKYNIITDHNVYHVYTFDGKELLETNEFPFLYPLYTFDSPLTKESAKILTYKYICATLRDKVKLEEMISTIPGSYKNGTWCQLNGFFGLYVNHEKEEVRIYPPELE